MTDEKQTKYGDQIKNHEWKTLEPDEQPTETTTIKNHTIDVIYTFDPTEDMGYGRKKYTAHITYNDNNDPEILYVIEHKWKGNYWRDVTDWNWNEIPEPVRRTITNALPVESPTELESGVQLMDEGGESRWAKFHKPQMEKMSGGNEMFCVSFLRDALQPLNSAAESIDTDSDKELIESLVSDLRDVITEIDGRYESNTGDSE